MKTCFICKQDKPLTEFYKHPRMSDGHLGKCKDCTKAYSKRHREENPEYYREYDKGRSSKPERIEQSARYVRAYRSKHPERHACNQKVKKAVDSGELIPQPCFICGKKAVAHHPDYSRPLDVTWLCPSHHRELHAASNRF